MVAEDIIIKPIITEKSTYAQAHGKYTFKVNKKATKIDIKNAVQKLFGVKVTDVTTAIVKGSTKSRNGKAYKTADWKKAVVTIATSEKEMSYLDKGGKVKKVEKKYKTSIEAFGA